MRAAINGTGQVAAGK